MNKLNSFVVAAALVATIGVGLFAERSAIAAVGQTGIQAQSNPSKHSPSTTIDSAVQTKTREHAIGSKALADLVWTITKTTAQHRYQPCSQKHMIAAGMKTLYLFAKILVPEDLEARSAKIANATQLAELFDTVLQKNESPREAELETALLQGILHSVPEAIALVDPPSKKELAVQEQVSANRYVGIGISIKFDEKEGTHKVVSAILHGAARKAGMKAGDLIESVDGHNTKGISLVQVIDWLRGPEGSPITVVVRHAGATESQTLDMIRAKVPFEHVYGYRRTSEEIFDFHVDPQAPIAYLRMGSFSSSSLHELRQFERKLRGEGFRGLVLDLRGNPGGSLQHAALVCGGLLDGNLMWTVKQQRGAEVQEFRADHECLFRDWPMVVLIDEHLGTAAALLAAALHDNGRAMLVGETVKSNGYIKSMVELPGRKESLVLATGMVDRPKAEQGWPLKPDFAVKLSANDRTELSKWNQQQETTDQPIDPKAAAPHDPQLAKATELLRAELAKASAKKS